MTYSQYAYVEAFLDMKQKTWINTHVPMYELFGGVAKYVRLPALLIDLEIARSERNYRKVMAKYANPRVLILDGWLFLNLLKSNRKISLNYCIGDVRSHLRFSVHSTDLKNGMIRSIG